MTIPVFLMTQKGLEPKGLWLQQSFKSRETIKMI